MNRCIILIGMKGCGKSTVGRLLAKKLGYDFIELDEEIEKKYTGEEREELTCRKIFAKRGADYFRSLETKALTMIKKNEKKYIVLACGGGTPLERENQILLRQLGEVIFLDVDKNTLLPRILKRGTPPFFPYLDDTEKSLDELLEKRRPIYEKIADRVIKFINESPQELVDKIV